MVFLYNTECSFDKQGNIQLKEFKWMLPIQAITKIVMKEIKGSRVDLEIEINGNLQNEILKKYK